MENEIKKKNEEELALEVKNISKIFKVPHKRIDSMKGAFVNSLKKNHYEEFKALDNISFNVKKGEFFGIIGRNGAGKSTLLKILASVYKPTSGVIKINGLISPFLELGIGFNPDLSGRDNIYLNATVLGMTKKQIDEKFEKIVAFAELENFIDQQIKNYSSGMQARLAFSVSIHANREILLMDEVLAVGDSNFSSKCLSEFNRYKEQGKTVILVTHDIGTVQKYCDRAMLIRNGKIVKIGNPEEVGSEYMYQNMTDDEKRMANEASKGGDTKLKSEKDKKKESKLADITKVEFLDMYGNVKNTFETGSDLTIRVYFNKKEKKLKLNLNFGVAILSQENSYILGINTIIDKINTKEYIKKGFFEVKYENIPLKSNSYYVKAGIWEGEDKLIDFLDKSNSFKMFSKDRNQGIVQLDYTWL